MPITNHLLTRFRTDASLRIDFTFNPGFDHAFIKLKCASSYIPGGAWL